MNLEHLETREAKTKIGSIGNNSHQKIFITSPQLGSCKQEKTFDYNDLNVYLYNDSKKNPNDYLQCNHFLYYVERVYQLLTSQNPVDIYKKNPNQQNLKIACNQLLLAKIYATKLGNPKFVAHNQSYSNREIEAIELRLDRINKIIAKNAGNRELIKGKELYLKNNNKEALNAFLKAQSYAQIAHEYGSGKSCCSRAEWAILNNKASIGIKQIQKQNQNNPIVSNLEFKSIRVGSGAMGSYVDWLHIELPQRPTIEDYFERKGYLTDIDRNLLFGLNKNTPSSDHPFGRLPHENHHPH